MRVREKIYGQVQELLANQSAKSAQHVVHLAEIGFDNYQRNPEGRNQEWVVDKDYLSAHVGYKMDKAKQKLYEAGHQVKAQNLHDLHYLMAWVWLDRIGWWQLRQVFWFIKKGTSRKHSFIVVFHRLLLNLGRVHRWLFEVAPQAHVKRNAEPIWHFKNDSSCQEKDKFLQISHVPEDASGAHEEFPVVYYQYNYEVC